MRWLAGGAGQLPPDDSWLTAGEAARAAAMRFTKRRTEFLVARWTAKQAVVCAIDPDIDPCRVEVRHHPTGAPEAYLDGAPLDIGISLTDRAGWAVCLLGGEPGAVGCDLELVEPRSAGFVRDYFTAPERHYIRADDLAANLLWSAKESTLKVLRTGLRRDTRTVEITLGERPDDSERPDGWARLTARTVEGEVFPGWWCRFGHFILTVAARHRTPPPAALADPPALATATPHHTWLSAPVIAPRPPCRGGARR